MNENAPRRRAQLFKFMLQYCASADGTRPVVVSFPGKREELHDPVCFQVVGLPLLVIRWMKI